MGEPKPSTDEVTGTTGVYFASTKGKYSSIGINGTNCSETTITGLLQGYNDGNNGFVIPAFDLIPNLNQDYMDIANKLKQVIRSNK